MYVLEMKYIVTGVPTLTILKEHNITKQIALSMITELLTNSKIDTLEVELQLIS